MLILSTILLRLWVVLAIPPNGADLLITLVTLCVYSSITILLGWRWGLVDLEPIQVWWNLKLYRYKLQLYNNRQAAKLMVMLWGWVALEEIVLRVGLVPLVFEQMPGRQRLGWIVVAGLMAIGRYVFLYCRLHPFFGQLRLLLLAMLLDLACLTTYILTESLWLTILFHWLALVSWLLPLGGLYKLRQYQILKIDRQKF